MAKTTISYWRIWSMAIGFLGIQVGFSLQTLNLSSMFRTLGFDVGAKPELWLAVPLTGLLVQPLVGYMSDKTGGRLGHRLPFLMFGALAAITALITIPNISTFWSMVALAWVLGASLNMMVAPYRALVIDVLPDRQHITGFAAQGFFIAAGGLLLSAQPLVFANWVYVANGVDASVIPRSYPFAFYIGAIILVVSILWTVFTTKEYARKTFNTVDQPTGNKTAHGRHMISSIGHKRIKPARRLRAGSLWVVIGVVLTGVIIQFALDKELFVLSGVVALIGAMKIIVEILTKWRIPQNAFSEIAVDLFLMPKTMKQLAVVKFFSWFAMFSLWIYATAAVTNFHFGVSDPTSEVFHEGVKWVGALFVGFNGFAMITVLAIPGLTAITSRKTVHMVSLSIGGIGLISFSLIRDPSMLILSMIGVGIAWASMLSVPYAILSRAIPSNKAGVYMGIFNIFIILPQLISATILGLLVGNLFDGQAIYALTLGGGSFLIAALVTLFVDDVSPQAAS